MEKGNFFKKKIIIPVCAAVIVIAVLLSSIFILPDLFGNNEAEKIKKRKSKRQKQQIISQVDDESQDDVFIEEMDFDDTDYGNDFEDFEDFPDDFTDNNNYDDDFIPDWEDTNNYDEQVEIPDVGTTFYHENFDTYKDLKANEEVPMWRIYPGGDDMFMYLDDTESRSGKFSGRVEYKSKGVGWGGMYTPLLNENWTSMDKFGFWVKGNPASDCLGLYVQVTTKNKNSRFNVPVSSGEWKYYSFDLRKELDFTEDDLSCVTEVLMTIGGGVGLPVYFDDIGPYNSKNGCPAATEVTKLDFENTGAENGGELLLGTVLENGNPMTVTLGEENKGKNHFGCISYSTTSELLWTGTVIPAHNENWQILSNMNMRVKTDGSRQLVKMGFYGKTNLWEYTFYADSDDWTDISAVWNDFKGKGAKNLSDVTAISLMFASKTPGEYKIYVDDITATYVDSLVTTEIDTFEKYEKAKQNQDNFVVDFGGDIESGDVKTCVLADFEDQSKYTLSENLTLEKNSFNGTNAVKINTVQNKQNPNWGIGTAEITFETPITVTSNTFAFDVTNVYRTDIFEMKIYKGDTLVGDAREWITDAEDSVFTSRKMIHTMIFKFDSESVKELLPSEYSGITKIEIIANPYQNYPPKIDNIRIVNDVDNKGDTLDIDFETFNNIKSVSGLKINDSDSSFKDTYSAEFYDSTKSWSLSESAIAFTKKLTVPGNKCSIDVVGGTQDSQIYIDLYSNGKIVTTYKAIGGMINAKSPTDVVSLTFESKDYIEGMAIDGIKIWCAAWFETVLKIDNIKFFGDNSGESGEVSDFDMSNWKTIDGYSTGIASSITEDAAHSGKYGAKITLKKGSDVTTGYEVTLKNPIDITDNDQLSLWIKGDRTFARQEFAVEIIGEEGTAVSKFYDLKSNNTWKNVVFDFSDLGITNRIGKRIIAYRLLFKQYSIERTVCVDDIIAKKSQKVKIKDYELLDNYESDAFVKRFSVHEDYADGITVEKSTAAKVSGKSSALITVPKKSVLNSYYSEAAITENFNPHIDGVYSGNAITFKFKGDGKKDTLKLKLIVECNKSFAESAWITADSSGEWVTITRSYVQLGLTENLSQEIFGITFLVEMENTERKFYIDDLAIDTIARVGAYITDTLDEFETTTPEYIYGTEEIGTDGKYDTSVYGGWMGYNNAGIIQGQTDKKDNWYGIKRLYNYPFDVWGDGQYKSISAIICTHAEDDNLKIRLTLYSDDKASKTVVFDKGSTSSAGCYTVNFKLEDFGFTEKQFKEISGYKFEMLLDDTFQAVYFDNIRMK